MKRRPPQWYQFDAWVWIGAGVGIVIAFALFCGVQLLVNGTKFFFDFTGAEKTPLSDIISMTATAIGGLAIGGVAVMQYRKHKWAEYQAKMDEDSRTGERLGKAIEHLGHGKPGAEDDLHIRLGAIYEFSNLVEDSPRNKENVVKILTAFIKSYQVVEEQELPQDVKAAAATLSQFVRKIIEGTARERREEDNSTKYCLKPQRCVFEATKVLSGFAIEENGIFHNEFVPWSGIRAKCLDLGFIELRGADLSNANLKGTSLAFAQLEGVTFSFAHLEGADFRYALFSKDTSFYTAHIDSNTRFDPGVRMKYFGVEEPEHLEDEE
ncbi:MAG: pentapeptide repeat-containing protein [Oscillospiraceae bacterium]|nr:pentapeptide repeat-containing protein [Oscillospiraceae bacterium]